MKKEPKYATEAALCADFIAWVGACAGVFEHGVKCPKWTAYAETAGWDILLVADDGTQIGIQAKLKFNMKVISQSIPSSWESWHETGPDYRAVLVPERDSGHGDICGALGLMLFTPEHSWDRTPRFSPGLDMVHCNGGWHYWGPKKRETLPEFVPDVPAGASAPVQLTTWKIAALRIIAILETRGHVTRKDFSALRLDARRWTGPGGWLVGGDTPGQYLRAPGLDFDQQHPTVYAQVLEEARKKMEVTIE